MAKKTAAKKPVTKKPRRRLKRTARRSLAAVLMITAVVVAAIPVPENAAAPENPDPTTPTEVTYAYDSAQYKDSSFSNGGVSLARPDDPKDIYKTHYIFRDGGSYRMEWKYEFMEQSVNNQTKGIICGYNDTYPEELLKVPTDPVFEYYTVLDKLRTGEKNPHSGRDTFAEFKKKAQDSTDTTGLYKTFTCGAEPNAEENLDDAEFQKYFPAEYQAQVTAANRYKTEKETWDKEADAWKAANPSWTQDQFDAWKTSHPEPTKTQVLKKTPADFSDADEEYIWRLYYCDTHSLSGYVLIRVADSDRTTTLGSVTTIYSYVPQRIDLDDKSAENDDENGFRIAERTSFIGIGDSAFGTNDPTGASTGVQNVTNIELPDAIKYIGDYAFAGSFIHSIKMVNVENVGNYAFKACPNLGEVEFEVGVTNIGKEAFYGVQNLKQIVFPGTVRYIGPAAFAECNQLSNVDFSKLSLELTIDDYAFYNDVAISKVDFVRTGVTLPANSDNKPYEKPDTVSVVGLGKGTFAVRGSVRGSLTEFLIPSGIDANESDGAVGLGRGGKGLGDFLLAGRTNLETVVMSENYGSSSSITLPNDLFFNCISLKKVVFPSTGNSCGFVRFGKDLFDTISNSDFVVWGPKYLSPSNQVAAYPRESTWAAKSAVSETIPYVYFENDIKYVEVSNDIYLQCIDANGMLISCVLRPRATVPSDGIDLPIPAEVAGITVKGIKEGCFSDNTLNQAVRTLTVLDDSELTEIGNSVFSGWENLQKVYIGNSVRTLGDNLFLNDKKLIDVTFNTPESAAGEFKVGTNAFLTTGLELTFHGIINENFVPYKQAVGEKNYIDEDRRTRICYKSLAPSSLTVMYDNATGQVTLLDYPKYEDIETILGEFYATKKGVNWKKWEKLDKTKAVSAADFYKDWMAREYYAQYASEQFDNKREAFRTAWNGATDSADVYNNYDVYGPWVTPYFVEHFNDTEGGSDSGNTSNGSTGAKAAFDWLFEPITAYAAPAASELKPYFEIHEYSVFGNYENTENVYGPYQTQTGDEQDVIDATRNIVVPDGVTSIDVNGFLEAEANSGNVATYFTESKLGEKTYQMYRTSKGISDDYRDREKDIVGGLFSGEYEDYKVGTDEDANPKESLKKGNDRLESIDLNGVVSLPQYAFDNCENLRKVTVGKDCTDIGILPFRGCTSLTNVDIAGDNPKYLVERDTDDTCKRIIYSRNGAAENGDPLYKIEECLETRGKNDSSSLVDSAVDSLLSQVNELAEGAFAACEFVEDVNLTGATNLSVISKRSFMDCQNLDTVQLPPSVNKIEEYAFYNSDGLSEVRIPGREVSFTDYVFEDNNKSRTDIVTYGDSAARRYADTNKDKYNLRWMDIGDLWEVKFFDMDGIQIGSTLSVENNTRLKREQIPADPVREGYDFDTWVGTGGITVEDFITAPTNFIAKYNHNSNGAPVDGKYVVEFLDGVDGQQLAGRGSSPSDGKYYVPAGESFADQGWPEPIHPVHEGFEEAGFSAGNGSSGAWTAQTVVNSNMTIVALYKASGNNGPTSGGSTNTSGNTTSSGTTSGGTTSTSSSTSSSSSSNKSSSSSSSGSSTSTTSTTNSSAAGMYTVFVENGYGSGSYAPGTMVIVTAAQPAAGMRFDKWTTESNGVTLVSVSLPATTFQMPANNVSIKANFVADTTPRATAAPGTGNSSGTGNGTTNDNGNTRVDIEKPGISNRDLATANVNGSTDNFIVKISETDEATRAVAAALTNKYGTLDNILYYAMDITLWDSTGTTQISDTTGLSVDITIPIPDSLVAYGGNNMAGAVVNGDQLESLNENFTTINGVPCIRFRATHFSPYTIYVDTGNLVEGMLDTTPKTGDPIHPKWFLSLGLACLSMILFLKRDKKKPVKVKKA